MNGDIVSPTSPSLATSASASSLPSIDDPPPVMKLSRKESLAHVFQEKLSTDEAEDNESEHCTDVCMCVCLYV